MARGEFEQIIKEFEGFDPNSFTFRYPINKDGSASLKEKHFVFSPKQLTSEPIGVFELLFPSCQQSRQDWPSGDPTDPLAVQPNRSIP